MRSFVSVRVGCDGFQRATSHSTIQPVVHVLLESAAFYFACLLIAMLTFLANSPGVAFIVEVTPPIVVRTLVSFQSHSSHDVLPQGLSYSAIIIRVGLGVAEQSHVTSSLPGSVERSRSRQQKLSHDTISHEYPLRVTVTQNIDHDGEADADVDSRATPLMGSNDKLPQPWELV
jgi:hypothetical protein